MVEFAKKHAKWKNAAIEKQMVRVFLRPNIGLSMRNSDRNMLGVSPMIVIKSEISGEPVLESDSRKGNTVNCPW